MNYIPSRANVSPSNADVLSVTDLTKCIRGVIEAEDLFRDVWVRGEISNFVRHSSGHRYFCLKDQSALIKCVIWNSSSERNRVQLADGMCVMARGRVTVYEKQGQYQLTVADIIPDGAGALFAAYEQLKARLLDEGLFDAALKRPIPPLPKRIAIVTSRTAAALRDMVTISNRRMPSVELVLIPALMQGADAEESVVNSLGLADSVSGADVIVLGRGGGSIEDLWTFNTERVVRAVRACKTPTVSAIGHETDFTLSDFAADLRAPTPSAAMELILPDRVELGSRIRGLVDEMKSSLDASIARGKITLDHLSNSPSLRYPEKMLQDRAQSLDLASERLKNSFSVAIALRENSLGQVCARLDSLSPLAVLSRGYALVLRTSDRRGVREIQDVTSGDIIETMVSDGRLVSEITEIKEGWN